MVRIRLRRMGAKKIPTYRVVVADKKSPRDGRFIEVIGTYNPRTEPETFDIDAERATHWMSLGAQPSESVSRLLKKVNVLDENGKLISPAAPEGGVTAAEEDAPEEAVAVEEAAS